MAEVALLGPNAEACFARRDLPRERQTRVRVNASTVVARLGYESARAARLSAPLRNAGWTVAVHSNSEAAPGARLSAAGAAREEARPAAEVSTEELLRHTSSVRQQDMDRAAGAWAVVLRSLGVPPDDATIHATLQEERGTRAGVREADALGLEIANAVELKTVLDAAGPPFSQYMALP